MVTAAAVSEQPLKDKERELLSEIYDRLELFEQGCRPYHDQAKVAREIVRLRDPFQDPPDAKEKTLQLQTLKSTINNCIADQMMNMPEAQLVPEIPERQEAVDDLQDLVHHVVYEVNHYDQLHRRRSEDLYVTGTAVTQIMWDKDMGWGRGDIALIRWPVEAFLWDPQADSVQDCRAIIKISWHPKSWYEEHYPDKAQYVSDEDGQYNEVGLPQVQQEKQGADEGRAMLVEYWWRKYDAKLKRYTINVAYCAGGALLDTFENVYNHGLYPFVVDVHSTIEGSIAGDGLVGDLTPMMRYINRYARYIDMNLRMSSKGRILTRRNSNIDREALADWSQDIVEGDSVVQGEDWNWMQHAPFNGMISNQLLQFQSDLKQDSGTNQFTRGESTGGITSGKAILALQSAGGKIGQLRTGTLNFGFKLICEQILWLMSEFYDESRVVMVTGKTATRAVVADTQRLFGTGKGVIAPPPYTVQVEVVSRDPIRISAMNEMYMQAYTMAAQAQQFFPLSALFQILNIEGKDRLLPVIRQNEQTQETLQQQAQQIEELTGQLQQMQQENDALKQTATQLGDSLANITAGRGLTPGVPTMEAGGGPLSNRALVGNSRKELEALQAMPEGAV